MNYVLQKPFYAMIIPSRSLWIELISIPKLQLLVVYFSALILTWLHGRIHFYRDPNSVFFDEGRGYEPVYGAQRSEQAGQFVEEVCSLGGNPHAPDVSGNATDARICASFITVGRQRH